MRDFTDSFDEIAASYAATALWSSYDSSLPDLMPYDGLSLPLDANYDASDISTETMDSFRKDIGDFLDLLQNVEFDGRLISFDDIADRMTWGQFGHDFWLTRNGHGAGFWDRGLGEFGDILSKWADTFGGVDLFVVTNPAHPNYGQIEAI